MKINKILAAGVAATLAVTSLSAVVSAEAQPREFELWTTVQTTPDNTVSVIGHINKDLGRNLVQNDQKRIILKELTSTFFGADSGWYGFGITSVSVQIKGFKYATAANGVQTATPVDMTFKFLKGASDAEAAIKDQWYIVALKDTEAIYRDGELATYYFDEITDVTFNFGVRSASTDKENIYKKWRDAGKNYVDIGQVRVQKYNEADGTYADDVTGATVGMTLKDLDKSTRDTRVAQKNTDIAKVRLTEDKTETLEVKIGEVAAYAAAADASAAKGKTAYKATGTKYGQFATADPAAAAVTFKTGAGEADADAVFGPAVTAFDKDGKQITVYALTTKGTGAGSVGTVGAYYTATSGAANCYPAAELTANAITEYEVNKDATAKLASIVNPVAADDGAADANAATKKWVIKGGKNVETTALFDEKILGTLPGIGESSKLISYAIADGGWYVSQENYGDNLADQQYYNFAWTASQKHAWLPITTRWVENMYTHAKDYDAWTLTDAQKAVNKALNDAGNPSKWVAYNKIDGTETITRQFVKRLSKTNPYLSEGAATTGEDENGNSANQSYVDVMTAGTYPVGFSGLATQVAEYFNKQTNGEITFTFTSNAAAGASGAWQSGIPSTEVGLIGSGAGTISSNFALFFNYESTNGMMYSPVKADLTKGEVTFDISKYLEQSGGLTMATLHDIYYGLNVGYEKDYAGSGNYGMYVSKVTLSYDDSAAAADAATDDAGAADADADADVDVTVDDDDDDDTAAVVDDDDDDDDDDTGVIADDDDDDDDDDTAAVISDDDEDDTAAAGDTDIVEPATTDDNPATGVGLAVIPAIVAAAAMAISKKRK